METNKPMLRRVLEALFLLAVSKGIFGALGDAGFHPDQLVARMIDGAASAASHTSNAVLWVMSGLLGLLATFALEKWVWPYLSSFGWLSLEAAAQSVYDQARNTVMAELARDQRLTDEKNPLVFVGNTLVHQAENMRGKLRGATKHDLIPLCSRKNWWTDAGLKNLGPMYQAPAYYDVEVKRGDLKEVVAYFNRMSETFL